MKMKWLLFRREKNYVKTWKINSLLSMFAERIHANERRMEWKRLRGLHQLAFGWKTRKPVRVSRASCERRRRNVIKISQIDNQERAFHAKLDVKLFYFQSINIIDVIILGVTRFRCALSGPAVWCEGAVASHRSGNFHNFLEMTRRISSGSAEYRMSWESRKRLSSVVCAMFLAHFCFRWI